MSNELMKVYKIIISILYILLFTWTGQAFGTTDEKLEKAYQLLKDLQYEAAVNLFESHLETNPADANIHLELAYVYIKLKQDYKAL
jgi:Tfp pilus assembly protein PilF